MPRFLSGTPSGIFRQQQQQPPASNGKNNLWCSATATTGLLSIFSRGDNEKNLLVLTNVVSWIALLTILCVWLYNKRRQQKQRRPQQKQRRESSSSWTTTPPLMTECPSHSESSNYSTVQQQQQQQQQIKEHESLIAALQEELHDKSVAENEQAILWRQEKKILQERILSLSSSASNTTNTTTAATMIGQETSSKQNHEAQLLQQVKDMQETITFLTNLTESQTEELESKQNEIIKLHNILEELQQHMGVNVVSGGGEAAAAAAGVSVTPTNCAAERTVAATETATTTTDDEDDDDDEDSDAVSIDSSVEVDDDVDREAAAGGGKKDKKCKLQEGNKVVLLVSTMPGNLSTSVHQSRLESIFRHGLQLHSSFLETVDGCDSDLTLLRNDLFQISGMHAVYPQVFLVRDEEIEFVGDFDTVQELHDARELPQRIGLLLPEENAKDEEKENNTNNGGDDDDDVVVAGATTSSSSNNKYGNLGDVLLDANNTSSVIAGVKHCNAKDKRLTQLTTALQP